MVAAFGSLGALTQAGEFSITHHVLPSAGGASGANRFSIHGTFGQPFAANDLTPGDPFDLRTGYWGLVLRWLNSDPRATEDFVARRPGESAHVLISQLLLNDRDPDFDTLTFAGFDPLSAQGGIIFRDGPWIIYQPPTGADPRAEDSFAYRVTDGSAAPVAGIVRLGMFIPSSSGPPNALAIVLDSGPPPIVRIRFQGIAGRGYVVESADTATGPWIPLAPVTAAPNGQLDYADTPSTAPRFYRLVEP